MSIKLGSNDLNRYIFSVHCIFIIHLFIIYYLIEYALKNTYFIHNKSSNMSLDMFYFY